MHVKATGVNINKAYTWKAPQIFQDDVTFQQGTAGELVKAGLGVSGQVALGANLDQYDVTIKRDVDGASTHSEAGANLFLSRDVTNVSSEGGYYLKADSVFALTRGGGAVFGTGTTNHSLSETAADVLISGKLEVNDDIYFDGELICYSVAAMRDSKELKFGSDGDTHLLWSTHQTNDSLVLGIGNTSNTFIITKQSRVTADKDFDHANQSNPTIFIHSATDPDTQNDEWISLTHDVTDGIVDVGSGGIKLGGSGFGCCNVGPQAQQAHIADAVGDLAALQAKFNTLLADLEGYGLLASA